MRATRIDSNHRDVVQALEKAGMTVESLAAVGKGCPDLVVGWRGITCLLEVKDGAKTPGNRPLTVAQQEWHARWGGQLAVVTTPEEAVDAVIAHARACHVL